MREIAGKTIVITGAASGLGRAVAIQLAERGAHVVLAARREAALEQTADYCRKSGGSAKICVTDVTQEHAVQRLLKAALEVNGVIDVWINNAGVTVFARLDEGPFEQHKRVIETNVLGSMLGARAVLPVFRRQRRGVLINVGSVLSKVGQPFVPSYVISKFAVRGLSEALRVDVAENPEIHVCSFLPYAIDTPHFEAGGNYVGKPAHAMQPIQTPDAVARALVRLVQHPRRERLVPRWMVAGYVVHALFPRFTERLLLRLLTRFHFENTRQEVTPGALFDSRGQPATVLGTRPPLSSRMGLVRWATREALALAGSMALVGATHLRRATTRTALLTTARGLRWIARERPAQLAKQR